MADPNGGWVGLMISTLQETARYHKFVQIELNLTMRTAVARKEDAQVAYSSRETIK